jgi:hypothetical protein
MRYFIVLLYIAVFWSYTFTQATQKDYSSEREITVCKIELTELGRAVSFHFNYLYRIKTNSAGKIVVISKLHQKHPKFVNEKNFIRCIKRWKLRPRETTYIQIAYGTTSSKKFLRISDKKDQLKILL